MIKLIAFTPKEMVQLPLSGLLPVGGAQCSGKKLKGLKEEDDYVVVSASGNDVALHPLKGKKSGPISLKCGETCSINDLTLGVLEDQSVLPSNGTSQELDNELNDLIHQFSSTQDLSETMQSAIRKIISVTNMEKGLLVARNVKGTFDLVAKEGVSEKEPWISESLIQETLKSQKGISIQNIYGSSFQNNRSLMATGFISVQTWPLVVRGETLGIVLVGSLKPHSGISKQDHSRAQIFSELVGLTLWFHLRDAKLKEEVKALRLLQQKCDDNPFTSSHPPLLETVNMARRVAPSTLSILIHGETGVGKELLASWIHQQSDRGQKPFVAVNCGAIPSELLESTLFGHKKGAFTGAHSDHVGKFQRADGGTLFLDEIGDLPENLQVKILRALQEKVVEPVGGHQPQKVDVRILAASHWSLPQLVSQGKFREDLYFRLAEIVIEIPPLRERPEDIVFLATAFLKDLAPEKRFSTGAWDWLKSQEWRGNVRELQSAIKRSAILSQGPEIIVDDFSKGVPSVSLHAESCDWLGGKTLDEAKAHFVSEKVKMALRRSGGQRNKAASLLGITPRTLFRYLEDIDGEKMTDLSFD